MDKTYYQDLNFEVLEFLENLKKEENYSFYPALKGLMLVNHLILDLAVMVKNLLHDRSLG